MRLIVNIVFFALLTGCSGSASRETPMSKDQCAGIEFWDIQRKGANQFNRFPSENWFKAAAKANIELVRLSYDKWESAERDFLLGNADAYTGLVEEDLQTLVQSLDWAYSYNIKIVLTPLSLPGARWKQNNDDTEDGRIWKDPVYLEQAKHFWTDLAKALDHHPAIVGFNLKNEPHPEIFFGIEDMKDENFMIWYDSIKGTVADINYFNRTLTEAIRSVDKSTPIVVESGLWGNAQTYNYLEPLDDPFVIYSFHVYDPYAFTTYRINQNKHPYPGIMPLSPWSDSIISLDKVWLVDHVKTVMDWSERYQIPAKRIFAAEFGCARRISGAETYLSDLISIFNAQKWHWAFYSYREDVWESMDYELGTKKVSASYWDHSGKAGFHESYASIYNNEGENRIWDLFEEQFRIQKHSHIPGYPESYFESKSGRLEYGWFSPEELHDNKLYPLVVFLHGFGQNHSVYLDWYKKDIQQQNPCFVYTPKTPVEWGDWSGWGNELSEPMKVAVKVLDSLSAVFPVDTCRIYVYGISMGGEGTFDLLDKYPDKFAAAMSVCGGGKPEWAGNIAKTPFWMFHGSDDEVNPVSLTKDVYDAMLDLDAAKMKYTEYPAFGHNIWDKVTLEDEWYTWFFSFNKCR